MSWIQITRDQPELKPGLVGDDVTTSVSVTVRSSHFEGDLWLRFELLTSGLFVIRRMVFESPAAITPAVLAAIPFTDITLNVLTPEDADRDQVIKILQSVGLTFREATLVSMPPVGEPPRPASREGPSRMDLELFAAEYRFAMLRRPNRAISWTMTRLRDKGLELSRATANRWRELCEETDPPLLPPSGRKRAAQRPDPDPRSDFSRLLDQWPQEAGPIGEYMRDGTIADQVADFAARYRGFDAADAEVDDD